MDAFTDAIDAIFADSNLARDAKYFATEDAEEGVDVRVVKKDFDQHAAILQTDAIVSGFRVDVRVSQVAVQPPEGARFELESGEAYRVRTSRRDERRLVWRCDVDEVGS